MPQPAPADDFPLEKIHAAFRQTRLIVLSLAATLPLYALVVELMPHSASTVSGSGTSMLRIACFAVAGVFIFTATVIKGVMLRRVPATPEARLTWLRAASLVTASFAEGPALLGFALFMINHSRGDFYILLVVAAYMIVRHLPLQGAWETYVRRGGDAR